MKIKKKVLQILSKINNSIYDDIKVEFLYHSNKLEGSTFNVQQLNKLLDEGTVVGEHTIDDIQTTINSMELFDFIVKTIYEPITPRFLCECHSLLMQNTTLEKQGLSGKFKSIPNRLRGINLETAQPYEVAEKIEELLKKDVATIEDIACFHQKFEHIHPFQDGNGRIGRFIIFKQCINANVDLIAIDNMYNAQYKEALYIAQTQEDNSALVEVFKKCQERLDVKFDKYKKYLEEINTERAGTNSEELFN